MIKKILRNIQYVFDDIINYNRDVIRVDWYKKGLNFGDILNPIVLENLTDRKVLNVNSRYCEKEHLLAIGSILDRATGNSIIWGSGFISAESTFIEKPKRIYAVRGPETRKKIIDLGGDCPEVYGDPALLMPFFYQPNNINKRYEVGIIPHYFDKGHRWIKTNNNKETTVIDIQDPNPLNVIDQILACENIISSSLHGLIVSDAYGVPSVWVKFSDKLTGGDFKFLDYFLSVGRREREPVVVNNSTEISQIIQSHNLYNIEINLQKLIDNFPYELKDASSL